MYGSVNGWKSEGGAFMDFFRCLELMTAVRVIVVSRVGVDSLGGNLAHGNLGYSSRFTFSLNFVYQQY